MKAFAALGLLVAMSFGPALCTAADKPRIFVLTDIENEPDDAMSMVRFLAYANQWDIEGLAATTSIHQKNKVAAWRIREIVEAYAQVRDNLEIHEKGFPAADSLRALVVEGRPDYGMKAVGKGMDSAASELLIAAADRKDPRPLWVPVWGGPNVLAQALWKVRATRDERRLREFVAKLRVYTISDQDDSGPWIRKNFPGLFYIVSPGFFAGDGYRRATWPGISDRATTGADPAIVDNPWLDTHVRAKGPLGAQYPRIEYTMEGDTPSFLFLMSNGLNEPAHPDWGGWGGRYELYTPHTRKWFAEPETRPIWTDTDDDVNGIDGKRHTTNQATIWRWRVAYQNDFVARMDWSIKPYAEANHPPVVKLSHPAELRAKPGDRVALSAQGTADPDGDALTYEWFYYPEPGTFTATPAGPDNGVSIENARAAQATLVIPANYYRSGTMHVILAVTDGGVPALTRYRRVIVTVQ
jgi:hypothetical protein